MNNEFSVWLYFPGGQSERVGRYWARESVDMAKDYSTRPAARMGVIREIRIVDAEDCCFHWKHGEGVVYPRRDAAGRFVGDP